MEQGRNKTDATHQNTVIRSCVRASEWIGLVADLFILLILLVNQIKYQMKMMFLIVPIGIIGFVILMNCISPEEYHFTEDSLETWQHKKRVSLIQYDSVFNMDTTQSERNHVITKGSVIKLYYEDKQGKKLAIYRPADTYFFKEQVIIKCPIFHDEGNKSELEKILN